MERQQTFSAAVGTAMSDGKTVSRTLRILRRESHALSPVSPWRAARPTHNLTWVPRSTEVFSPGTGHEGRAGPVLQFENIRLTHAALGWAHVPFRETHSRPPLLGSSAGFAFFQRFENGFFRILEGGKDVLGNLLNELVPPERVRNRRSR